MPHWELLAPVEVEVSLLAHKLANGCNCKPSALTVTPYKVENKIRYDNYKFQGQQLFLIDIDNTEIISGKSHKLPKSKQLMPMEALKKANEKGLHPSFMYETHSSSKNCMKYRIAFVLDKPVYTLAQREKIQRLFFECYSTEADEHCKDVNRGFFGGHSGTLLYSDFEAVNSVGNLLIRQLENYQYNAPNKKRYKGKKPNQRKKRTKNIELIKKHDVKQLRAKVGNEKKIVFDTPKEFFYYIYHEIDLAELLEVEEKELFNCLFHDDKEPSANIFKGRYGIWQYRCYGCEVKLNTKQIIEKLGDFNSEYQAIKFIKDVYNLDIVENEWTKEQTANIDLILKCLTSTSTDKSFSELCPTAAINTRFAKEIYIQILLLAKSTICPERITKDGSIVFYMGLDQIIRISERNPNKKNQVNQYIAMLIYHGMLSRLKDEEVPHDMLQKAIRQSRNAKNHISFYSIPSWVIKRLEYIESQGKSWKQNGYTRKATSYNMFLLAEGAEVANKIYPQTAIVKHKDGTKTNRKPSKRVNNEYELIKNIVINTIQDKSYCTVDGIKKQLYIIGWGKDKADYRIKQCLADIINGHNLTKARCTNALKERFNVMEASNTTHPTIIYFDC